MKTFKLNPEDVLPAAKAASRILKRGGLVIIPTDTVYVSAVNTTNKDAVKKLLDFKERKTGKGISVFVLDQKMAEKYVRLNENALNIYQNLLPGPFTVVSESKGKVVKLLEAENGTLGIRIIDYPFVVELVRVFGKPVTATSANISGTGHHYSIPSLFNTLSRKRKNLIDLVINAGKLPRNLPSTVIDTTGEEVVTLRTGDIIPGTKNTFFSKSESKTKRLAHFLLGKEIKQRTNKPIIFLLEGELGAGKTVFTKGLGKALGLNRITSPTYFIYREYKLINRPYKKFFHFDLYRISRKFELEEISFLKLFKSNALYAIEWPEKMGQEYLNKLKKIANIIYLKLQHKGETEREITYFKLA